MLHAEPEGFYELYYDPLLQGKRDPENAGPVRCPDELEQNEFQTEKVLKPVHKDSELDEVVCFKAANQDILKTFKSLSRCLGRWYDSSLKDSKRGSEYVEYIDRKEKK
ncbi:hypothetical protein PoB_001029600 [Plakobranchus ocellatus]|uniref:Uncharacterized protein n=1 Tax=Plakobranchus ocellatus TaxID=259542 RepID=A0AAV3YKI4_9GAST|nr:hypothetical protein PoB_001029600 [Plakobranchus ocellatus]